MPEFRFSHPIEVRYGDVDAQGHLNHAAYFTFMEHARIRYLHDVGLWDMRTFAGLGVIVAEARCSYRRAVLLGETVNVAVRVPRIGNKSLLMEYRLTDAASGVVVADGQTVIVAYDYDRGQSASVPDEWREKIAQYESVVGRQ